MARRSLSPTARLRIFQDHRGVCDICGDLIEAFAAQHNVDLGQEQAA